LKTSNNPKLEGKIQDLSFHSRGPPSNSKCSVVSNKVIHTHLKIQTIREEITKFSVKYRDKITTHPTEITSTLLEEEEPTKFKRFKPTDLTTRF
jgi:hypothetical protein